jgi:hypothetical protein
MDYRHIDAALTDPGFFVDHDPHPLWKELRENDPIHWTDDSRKGFLVNHPIPGHRSGGERAHIV